MRKARLAAALLALSSLWLAGCSNTTPGVPPASSAGPEIDPVIFAKPGQSHFLTANESELLSSQDPSYAHGQNGRTALGGEGDFAGASPPTTPATPSLPPEVIPDPTREIVEADVYKLEGTLLYVLNRYRGLVIIDVADPDHPRIRGRLPFQAMPIEMYVREGRAYVVSSDYFEYWQYDPEADPHGFHGSQVMIADVSNPDAPVRMGALALDGEVTDTRMVGDVLYTVSKRRPDYWRYNTADWEDRTWIVSLNVKDPNDIKKIDKITFAGTSTLIHVAQHAIFVAAWDPNFYLTSPDLEQQTLVTYVDISDPSGRLAERGKVYIPGQIADKFKMDWFEGHLRVLSQRWSGDDPVTLQVVSTAYPDRLQIDTSLDIAGVTRAGLQASRFDGPRAFAFTSHWTGSSQDRHLYTLDLSTPLAPRVAGALAVDVDSTHLEVHADRLLMLGHFYSWNGTSSVSKAAVALFDIGNLASPSLLATSLLGEGWSSSAANYDYKAFKSFPDLDLILVPLQFWNNGQSFTGVDLVDWYGNTLTERGRVENTGGVTRAFPVGDRLVAVGELSVAVINAQDRDHPVVTSQLKLVHQVHDVFEIEGRQVQLVTDVYSGQVRLEVRPFGVEDDSPPVATLDLPFAGAPYVLRDGDVLHFIGSEANVGQTVRSADLTTPDAPKLRGSLTLSSEFASIYYPGWSFYNYYWNPSAGLPLRNQIVPATFRTVTTTASGRRDWSSELRFLDLRDLDHPHVAAGKVPMNDYPFVNKVTHGNVLYSTHVEQATSPDGASLLYHVRSFVDRVDVTDPDHPHALPSVNVPGYLVDVSDDGSLWYTVDFQWDDFGRRRNAVNTLKLTGDVAVLVTVLPVADQINRAALRPGQLSEHGGRPAGWSDRTIWLTAHKYPWWGVHSDTVSSRQPYTVLERVDFSSDGTIASDARSSLEGYHFDLLDVEASRLYLSSASPSGLLVLDVANLVSPNILSTSRTLGYVSRVVAHGNDLYAPLGMFGLQHY